MSDTQLFKFPILDVNNNYNEFKLYCPFPCCSQHARHQPALTHHRSLCFTSPSLSFIPDEPPPPDLPVCFPLVLFRLMLASRPHVEFWNDIPITYANHHHLILLRTPAIYPSLIIP